MRIYNLVTLSRMGPMAGVLDLESKNKKQCLRSKFRSWLHKYCQVLLLGQNLHLPSPLLQ